MACLTDTQKKHLVERASVARQNAYTPYSHYPVGAALLAQSGLIYTGANIDNAAYPATICAERVAIFKAVSEGEREFKAIALVTRDGGSPCGCCRQVLSEFGLDICVIIADEQGRIVGETTVDNLLPGSFGRHNIVAG